MEKEVTNLDLSNEHKKEILKTQKESICLLT